MWLKRRPPVQRGETPPLREDQFEGAQTYLTRERRILFLRGVIVSAPTRWDNFGCTAVHDAIIAMNHEDHRAPIYLMVDSEGGTVRDGFVLYDIIRASRAPVVTLGLSAASMATLILAAGDKRLVYPHASLMMHLPMAAVQGDVKEIEIRSQELNRIRDSIVDAYIERGVKRSHEEILSDMDREHWMTAQEAVEYGLADGIATPGMLMGYEEVKL